MVLAILTMTVGNVVAIVQNNVKRMLAYSSIAHAGYALVGFIAAGAAPSIEQRNAAITAVIFYLLTYAVMNIGAFAVVQLIARTGDRRTEVEDYNGIGFGSPVLAFSLSLFLLSLLGMPLTAGFMGKIMVFRAALDQGYGDPRGHRRAEHRSLRLLLPASDHCDVLSRTHNVVDGSPDTGEHCNRADDYGRRGVVSRTLSWAGNQCAEIQTNCDPIAALTRTSSGPTN